MLPIASISIGCDTDKWTWFNDCVASTRIATPDDATCIAWVQVETWRTTYRGIVPDAHLADLSVERRAFRWREHLNSADHILVAECGGEVVGFIGGGPIREPVAGCDAELYAIYLLLKSQRVRIGTKLLIELGRRLDEVGFRSMAVWLFEANAAARFYERSGAIRIGAKEREVGACCFRLLPTDGMISGVFWLLRRANDGIVAMSDPASGQDLYERSTLSEAPPVH